MRRAADIVLATPGVAHAVNVVGFSGATFTNAPNAGAMFIVLDPFEERAKDPTRSGPAIQAELFKLSAIQDAFLIVVLPPPVSGIGNAGGFRMMVDPSDSGGAGDVRPDSCAALLSLKIRAGFWIMWLQLVSRSSSTDNRAAA